MIRFKILGMPSAQGGMRAVNTARGARMITAGGTGLKSWRTAVAETAEVAAFDYGCQTMPLEVIVVFRLPMPKSAPRHDKEAGRRLRARTPDLDKLLRALFDGLTAGGLIADDALIARVAATKTEVWESWIGADVTIQEAVPL